MKSLNWVRYFRVWSLSIIFLGACTFPVTMSDDFTINFRVGTGGYVIPVGEEVQLVATGASTAGDTRRALFFADGDLVGEARDWLSGVGGSHFDYRTNWTPSEPGEVTLQVAIQRGGSYGYSETVTVCVLPFERDERFHHELALASYDGDCTIPERSPTATSGAISMEVDASPESVTYIPWELDYVETCDRDSSITFDARVTDPPDDVALVTVSIQIEEADGWLNAERTLILNHIGDEAPNTKIFNITYNASRMFQLSLSGDPSSTRNGEITWIARAFGRDGRLLLEDGPFSIPAMAVHCDGSSYLITTVAPIIIKATPTPASAQDCPPGTYFSETTNKCINIQIPTKKPNGGDGDGSSCSDYGSKDSCTSNGCSWNPNSSTCQ